MAIIGRSLSRRWAPVERKQRLRGTAPLGSGDGVHGMVDRSIRHAPKVPSDSQGDVFVSLPREEFVAQLRRPRGSHAELPRAPSGDETGGLASS